jgi:hypothetical protein
LPHVPLKPLLAFFRDAAIVAKLDASGNLMPDAGVEPHVRWHKRTVRVAFWCGVVPGVAVLLAGLTVGAVGLASGQPQAIELLAGSIFLALIAAAAAGGCSSAPPSPWRSPRRNSSRARSAHGGSG